MPLSPSKAASIVDICWACHGTGVHFKTISPLTYRRCWACYGRGGRMENLWHLGSDDDADATSNHRG